MTAPTVRLTAGQALVRWLQAQYSERDGEVRRAVPAIFGIFGHGNVLGVGQAIEQEGDELPLYQPKNEQAMVESRIAQLQEKLRMATVIQAKDLSTDVVQVGSVVHVKDEKTGKSVKYTIVGSAESKPDEHKLSNESPVGKAIMGRKKGEIVEVAAPRGKMKFKIMDIKAA